MNEPLPGRYRHYKGPEYTVLGVARHSETEEEMVVYRQEYGEYGLWVRPKAMFLESVVLAGQTVPRFQRIGPPLIHPDQIIENVFSSVPEHLPQEVVHTLLQAQDVSIERIVSHGHSSPSDFWYEQPQHEWVLVLQGAAKLQFEDRTLEMKPGDYINIPAYEKHRVAWTTPDQPTLWLCIWYTTPTRR